MTVVLVSFAVAAALFFAIVIAGRELRDATRAHNERAERDFRYARERQRRDNDASSRS